MCLTVTLKTVVLVSGEMYIISKSFRLMMKTLKNKKELNKMGRLVILKLLYISISLLTSL